MEDYSLIEKECLIHSDNTKRPAGNFFTNSKKLYRPVQNNIKSYGENIYINEILSLNPFKEKVVYKLLSKEYGNKYNNLNTHTLAIDNDIIIVDVLENVDLPFVYRLYFIRKLRNLFYKIKFKLFFYFFKGN